MAVTTYDGLRTQVAAFLQRDDLTAQVPVFVEMATAYLSDALRVPEMESIVTTSPGSEYTGLPSDFRALRSITLDGEILEYRTPWQIERLSQRTFIPETPVYSIQDMQIRVYPAPSSGTLVISYYAAIPALVADSDSNWLLLKRWDIYLQAALSQAYLFLHDDARYARSVGIVDKYVAEQNRAARDIMVGSSPLTIRPA